MNDYYGYADIYTTNNDINPIIVSPNTHIQLQFMQTKESLSDPEIYQRFIRNVESKFRNSTFYTNYKSFLYSIGLDHCQVHGNISAEMVDLEMHHNILNLFDIAFVICEHMLNSGFCVNTCRLVQLLKQEHRNHCVALVMLTKTPHNQYHNSNNAMYIPPKMCFAHNNFFKFIERYKLGLTNDIAFKLIAYFDKAIENGDTFEDNGILDIRNNILSWAQYNECCFK